MELTEKILEEKYQAFIRMFLEKTNYFLIRALRVLNELPESQSSEQINTVNPSTQVISSKEAYGVIQQCKSITSICKTLATYQKLIASRIPLKSAFINHSKIEKTSIQSLLSKLSPVDIIITTKIQQEWGGSSWRIQFYTDQETNEYIYCEEIGKYAMSFLFKETR